MSQSDASSACQVDGAQLAMPKTDDDFMDIIDQMSTKLGFELYRL